MTEDLIKILDSKRILRSNINKFKEYFVRFYGESERNRIEEAFSKTLLIPYIYPSTAGTFLSELQKAITNDILDKYRKDLSLFDLTGLGDFSDLNSFNLYLFTKLIEELNKEEKDQDKINELFEKLRFLLNKIDKNINPNNIDEFRSNKVFKELELLAKEFPNMYQEYNKEMSKFKVFETLVHKTWKMESIIRRKYFKEFIRENLINLPDDIKEQAMTYLESNSEDLPKQLELIFGRNLTGEIKGNEQISKEHQDKIAKSKFEFIKKCELEIQKNHFFCRPYQEEIDALDLVKPIKLEEEMYDSSTANIPNIVKKNGKYELFCPILICFDKETGKIDHNIVHELNHLLEQYVVDANDEEYKIISGWDTIIRAKDESENKKENTRNYELFNEIINELITQDICREMQKDGFLLFDKKENCRYNESGYEKTAFLVREFYEKYKNKILESRRDGNISIIWDTIGKENFDALNSLFDTYKEDLKKHISDEERKQLEQERDKILKRMEDYSRKSKEAANFGVK